MYDARPTPIGSPVSYPWCVLGSVEGTPVTTGSTHDPAASPGVGTSPHEECTMSLTWTPTLDRALAVYADREFQGLAAWARELTDAAGADAGPGARERMHAAFRASSEHELAFWESAWRSG